MSNCQKTLLAWSSGKDSAWALHTLLAQRHVEVVGLLTTFDEDAERVPMHDVREALVEAQARAAGLPLHKVKHPPQCSNTQYEAAMAKVLSEARTDGVTAVAFGDLFLEDVRRYREERLAAIGMATLFPLWGLDTRKLAHEMLRAGLKALVTSVDTQQLDARFAGQLFDDRMLDNLPATVDPCGERGEFHTFAYDGPMFCAPLSISRGELAARGQFVYADVLPAP